jgi:hypothetical protein
MAVLNDIRLYLRGPNGARGGLAGSSYLVTEAYSHAVTGISTYGTRILAVELYQTGSLKQPEMDTSAPDGRDGLSTDEIRLEADLDRLAALSHDRQVLALLDLIHDGSMRASAARGWGAEEQLEAARRRWGTEAFTSFTVALLERPSRRRERTAKLSATVARGGMSITLTIEDAAGNVLAMSESLNVGFMSLATRNSFPGQLRWTSEDRVDLTPKPRRHFDAPLHEISLPIPAGASD